MTVQFAIRHGEWEIDENWRQANAPYDTAAMCVVWLDADSRPPWPSLPNIRDFPFVRQYKLEIVPQDSDFVGI